MYCASCGKEVRDTDKFCQACGRPVAALPTPSPAEKPSPKPAPAPQPAAAAAPAAPQADAPAPPAPAPAPPATQPAVPPAARVRAPWRDTARTVARFAVALLIAAGAIALAWQGPVWVGDYLQEREQRSAPDYPAPEVTAWLEGDAWTKPATDTRVVDTDLPSLASQPDYVQGRIVRFEALAGSVASRDGSPLITLVDGDAQAVGYYPASRMQPIEAGATYVFAGVPGPDGTDVLVLAVSPTTDEVGLDTWPLGLRTLAASAAFLLAAAFLRIRRARARSRRRSAVPAVAAAIALLGIALVSGCTVEVETKVQADGSGSVTTRVNVGQETMDEILGLPNGEAFMESWERQLASEDTTVTRNADQIRLVRSFDSPAQFNQSTGGGLEGSWSYLRLIDMPDGRHYVYMAHTDTSGLFAEQGSYDEDGSATEELNSRLEEAEFSFDVSLPGNTVGSSELPLTIPIGDAADLFAESYQRVSTASGQVAPELIDWWRLIERGIWAAAAGVFVFALLAYRWRTR